MSHGQFGFDPHRARRANKTQRAQNTITCWRMGRRHLNDAIDEALYLLVKGREPASKAARRQMVLTLSDWIAMNPHLPSDLVTAIKDLVPEIGQQSMTDEWAVGLEP